MPSRRFDVYATPRQTLIRYGDERHAHAQRALPRVRDVARRRVAQQEVRCSAQQAFSAQLLLMRYASAILP